MPFARALMLCLELFCKLAHIACRLGLLHNWKIKFFFLTAGMQCHHAHGDFAKKIKVHPTFRVIKSR